MKFNYSRAILAGVSFIIAMCITYGSAYKSGLNKGWDGCRSSIPRNNGYRSNNN